MVILDPRALRLRVVKSGSFTNTVAIPKFQSGVLNRTHQSFNDLRMLVGYICRLADIIL